MFALIETNGATHIAVNIPLDGAEKSLPALARMLETNAIFITKNWSTHSLTKPTMGITLGDSLEFDGTEGVIKIESSSNAVLGDDFVNAAPDVFVSNTAALKKKDDDIARLRAELTHVNNQLSGLKDQIEALTNGEAA